MTVSVKIARMHDKPNVSTLKMRKINFFFFTVQKMFVLNTDNRHVNCVTEWKSLQFIAEMWYVVLKLTKRKFVMNIHQKNGACILYKIYVWWEKKTNAWNLHSVKMFVHFKKILQNETSPSVNFAIYHSYMRLSPPPTHTHTFPLYRFHNLSYQIHCHHFIILHFYPFLSPL